MSKNRGKQSCEKSIIYQRRFFSPFWLTLSRHKKKVIFLISGRSYLAWRGPSGLLKSIIRKLKTLTMVDWQSLQNHQLCRLVITLTLGGRTPQRGAATAPKSPTQSFDYRRILYWKPRFPKPGLWRRKKVVLLGSVKNRKTTIQKTGQRSC